ncbi:tetratricopeptide repeat protein [Oceanobacillus sp. CAU 1775]
MDTILQAVQLVENNQIDEALRLLQEFSNGANDDEKYTIAELYLQWGFLDEAKEILKELIHKYPDESDLILSLSDIYIEQENDEEAMELLAEIGEDQPEYVQVLLQLADLYQSQGLFEVAEQKLLEAKNLMPNEVIIDFALGELFFSIGEFLKATTYYEKVSNESDTIADISVHDRLAESYAAIGEYEKSLDYFKTGETETPDKYFKYGVTAKQADRNDIAIYAWKRVLELDEYYHTVYLNLAEALLDEAMYEEAYETVKKGLQVDEFNKQLYFIAGKVTNQLNALKESEEYLREAIALDPDYMEAILFLVEHLKEANRYEEVIELITEVKSIGSGDPLYDWELARAYNEEENFDEALKAYRETYEILNDDTDFLKEYGYFLTEDGQIKEAINVFENYLKHEPEDYEIEEFYSRLKLNEENEGEL